MCSVFCDSMASVKNVWFHNLPGAGPARFNEVCKFYIRGTCNKNPCPYLHVDLPLPDSRLRVFRQSHPSVKQKPRNSPYSCVKYSLFRTRGVGGTEDQNCEKISAYSTKTAWNNNIVERPLTAVTGGCVSESNSYQKKLNQGDGDQPKRLPVRSLENSPVSVAGASASEDISAQRILHHGTDDQSKKPSDPSLRNSLVSAIGGSDEDKSAQKSLTCGTEDQMRKLLDTNMKNISVSSSIGAASVAKNIQESSISVTREVISKKISALQKCHSNLLPDGNVASVDRTAQISQERACKRWMSGNCSDGNQCPFLHSWFSGDGFTKLAKLSGHSQALSGIALPSGSDKLYSGSRDGTVRIWDCHTGQRVQIINTGYGICSLISEGSWVFVGMPNVVKAWNIELGTEFVLNVPVGKVQAMAVARDMLFAGAQSGIISIWKGSTENPNPFQLAASLKGHTGAVICLTVGGGRLYSGSTDSSIRVWSLDTLECLHILGGHKDVVMSLIWSNQCLLSCSLDQTIKVWSSTEGDKLEVTYTHNVEDAAIALCGLTDGEDKPILLCSSLDDIVFLYELPSFAERGRIFSVKEVRTICAGPGGLFFTGDGSGMLTVWKLSEASQMAS